MSDTELTEAAAPAPKRRGRPRKNPVAVDAAVEVAATVAADEDGTAKKAPARRTAARKAAADGKAAGAEAVGVAQVREDADKGVAAATPESAEAPAPKRRGRPRKNPVAPETAATADAADTTDDGAEPKVRSTRGRKPKAAAAAEEAPVSDALMEDAQRIAAAISASAGAAAADAVAHAASNPAEEGASAPEGRVARRPRRTLKATTGKAIEDEALASSPAHAQEGADGARVSGGEGTDRAQNRNQNATQAQDAQSGQNPQAGAQKSGKQNNAAANGGNTQQNNRQNNNKNNKNNRNQKREVVPSVTIEQLEELKVAELRLRAVDLDIDPVGLKKEELVQAVYEATMRAEGFMEVSGILDIMPDGYGFLRTKNYLPSESDCYVGLSLIKRNGLRKGDYLTGQTRPPREGEKYAAIQKIETINGLTLEVSALRPKFENLTPVYPEGRLTMEHGKNTLTARVIDLVAPIGKGQRGLIVSPPKAGKTTILKDIAASISANNPEVHLMCLLIDERPEEVTDMERSIKGEVISSTFDMPADNHIAVSELVIERAKRLVEVGRDVVILLDSITRLARAYNLAQPASGRVLSGGVDSTALYPPKRFLGAARNIENGGSLTILATGLVETGSKMDEVIFEEFKGTGNMELRLDRSLADRRIFPAIDPITSGTRKEELLLDPQLMPLIWAVRRILANMNNTERAMDTLIKSLKQTDNNNEFLIKTAKRAQHTKTESLEF